MSQTFEITITLEIVGSNVTLDADTISESVSIELDDNIRCHYYDTEVTSVVNLK